MDKTIKQIIKENHATGNIKDIVWNEQKKQWVVTWVGKAVKPNYYSSFWLLMQEIKEEAGH